MRAPGVRSAHAFAPPMTRAADLAGRMGPGSTRLPASGPGAAATPGSLTPTAPTGAGHQAARPDDQHGHLLRRAMRDGGQDGGVGVGGQHDARVAQHLLHHPQVHPGVQSECGRAVPEVMQPDKSAVGRRSDEDSGAHPFQAGSMATPSDEHALTRGGVISPVLRTPGGESLGSRSAPAVPALGLSGRPAELAEPLGRG
jgi:hypothetical protein